MLECVRDRYRDCLVVSLHDDAQIAGPLDRAREALAELIEMAAAECGLVPMCPLVGLAISCADEGCILRCVLARTRGASCAHLARILRDLACALHNDWMMMIDYIYVNIYIYQHKLCT